MKLGTLIKDMETIEATASPEADISGLEYDSRKVSQGDLFVALRGAHTDGHAFIPAAFKRGAVAVVCEERADGPIIRVRDTRDALARLADNFFGRPSEALTVIGITGTNGKTTTSYIIKAILEHTGEKTGLIGTINYLIGQRALPAPHTTPEALEFQGLLGEMRASGLTHVVAEVSSHALAQKRADYTRFRYAVFTNLTREHLDFHGAMEDYYLAKKRLFHELLRGTAVINADDPYGRRLLEGQGAPAILGLTVPALTYGLADADLTASGIKESVNGVSFALNYKGRRYGIESPLLGIPNVYNILASLATAVAMGIPLDVAVEAVGQRGPVAGRFERVSLGQDFLLIVDYAHTEDALRRLIQAVRGFTKGRVITVFGCGGDRDRGKRPQMGRAAGELSDLVFVTSDNPRSEEPLEIIREITACMNGKNYHVIPERRQAVRAAIMEAKAGDAVLIAGKGHEDYQEIKGERHPFSDRVEAEEAIKEKLCLS